MGAEVKIKGRRESTNVEDRRNETLAITQQGKAGASTLLVKNPGKDNMYLKGYSVLSQQKNVGPSAAAAIVSNVARRRAQMQEVTPPTTKPKRKPK